MKLVGRSLISKTSVMAVGEARVLRVEGIPLMRDWGT